VAKAIKLGRGSAADAYDAQHIRMPDERAPSTHKDVLPPKEKYECTKNADCSGTYVCRSNKCVDPCTGVSCAAGKKCSAGSCVSCAAGATDCKCSSPAVANGSGGCIDACSPNRCASATPSCTRTGNGTSYSCSCTASSCGAGKQCSGSSCTNCAVNTQCTCPSGQVANGAGGCMTPGCSGNSDCGAGKQCLNAGTTSASCQNCGANAQCTCPSGYLANGSGGCVKPVCTDNTTCGAGRQCIDPGKYNAKCDPCPSGTQCTCPAGQEADGSGGCKTKTPEVATPISACNPNPCPARTPTCNDEDWSSDRREPGKNYACMCKQPGDMNGSKGSSHKIFSTPSTISSCGPGYGCYTGYCEVCEEGYYGGECGCFGGTVTDGKGGCKPNPNLRYHCDGDVFVANYTFKAGNGVTVYAGDRGGTGCDSAYLRVAQEGTSWVFPGASIGGTALLERGATISGTAMVYGDAEIDNNARIEGSARVYGKADIRSGVISGSARICDETVITNFSGTISSCQASKCSDCPGSGKNGDSCSTNADCNSGNCRETYSGDGTYQGGYFLGRICKPAGAV
jgi:hypothetical protein